MYTSSIISTVTGAALLLFETQGCSIRSSLIQL